MVKVEKFAVWFVFVVLFVAVAVADSEDLMREARPESGSGSENNLNLNTQLGGLSCVVTNIVYPTTGSLREIWVSCCPADSLKSCLETHLIIEPAR